MNQDYRDRPPIDDLLLALHLLEHGNGSLMRLMTKPDRTRPYIEVRIFGSGYTREEYSESEFYPIAVALAEELKREDYVEARQYWGGSDPDECTLSRYGGRMLATLEGQFERDVDAFMRGSYPNALIDPCATVRRRICSMRFRERFDDFFIALHLNGHDEVRRTRGVLSFVPRAIANAE